MSISSENLFLELEIILNLLESQANKIPPDLPLEGSPSQESNLVEIYLKILGENLALLVS